jgi:peroxiredoxin Q/BCP
VLAGRIGITLLCIYLLGVALRIGGCHHPEATLRDELADHGPAVGERFPAFSLPELSGATMSLTDLAGAPAVLVLVPSLDWSPPTKARLLDLVETLRGDRTTRVVVLVAAEQATPRSATFARDHALPFHVLVDDTGMLDRLRLLMEAPDGTAAAVPATFVLDADGVVRARDTRKSARIWPDAPIILDAAHQATAPPPAPQSNEETPSPRLIGQSPTRTPQLAALGRRLRRRRFISSPTSAGDPGRPAGPAVVDSAPCGSPFACTGATTASRTCATCWRARASPSPATCWRASPPSPTKSARPRNACSRTSRSPTSASTRSRRSTTTR